MPGAKANGNGAHLGLEEKLWAAADKMRGHMDAAEYKHVVLGLIFLSIFITVGYFTFASGSGTARSEI